MIDVTSNVRRRFIQTLYWKSNSQEMILKFNIAKRRASMISKCIKCLRYIILLKHLNMWFVNKKGLIMKFHLVQQFLMSRLWITQKNAGWSSHQPFNLPFAIYCIRKTNIPQQLIYYSLKSWTIKVNIVGNKY